jgi:hypothetical protein
VAQQPKRLPGERNPEPRSDEADHIARASWMTQGAGHGDHGIAGGIAAFFAWRRRRKAIKNRR